MSLELHPLCTLFPRLEGVEFEALKADIEANGQLQPIVLHDGKILDGGNRYRACVELGIEPLIADMDLGDCDLLSYVLSVNLLRRHLTQGQHAAIVAAATNWLEAAQQGDNQYTGLSTPNRPVDETGPVTLPDLPKAESSDVPLRTVAERAAMSGVSEKTQRMADKVAKADPELAKEVAHGNISLPKALKQVERKDSDSGDQSASFRDVTVEESSSQSGPAPMDDPEFEIYLNGLLAQIDSLQRANDALSASDQGAEMMKQTQLLLNAENSLKIERERGSVREKQLNWFGRQYVEMRKILGVKTDRDVLSAVRKLTEKTA
ncbi:S-adenosylmethionine-binding protein [Paraburkholderia dipogonis]|uniref:S-adenosylmethionine-binding protein n=1 Tax=Paraburkholderia dipogonis TaxID=1211383 RepID=A0A4Y8N1L0_9BURK|nr:ParB N-terminal domain-containing protein [Paraburkholderia dipogonis]TFE43584.1 S-adenosylmethionine-binding protein [Paraburkholderia dipogonis]